MFSILKTLHAAFTDLHCLVEDAAADLNHFQVLLLLVSRALDVRHPAPLVLLAGVYEVPDRAVLIEDLQGAAVKMNRGSPSSLLAKQGTICGCCCVSVSLERVVKLVVLSKCCMEVIHATTSQSASWLARRLA